MSTNTRPIMLTMSTSAPTSVMARIAPLFIFLLDDEGAAASADETESTDGAGRPAAAKALVRLPEKLLLFSKASASASVLVVSAVNETCRLDRSRRCAA